MTATIVRPQASLDERYSLSEGWVYLTGMQALVRLPLSARAWSRIAFSSVMRSFSNRMSP